MSPPALIPTPQSTPCVPVPYHIPFPSSMQLGFGQKAPPRDMQGPCRHRDHQWHWQDVVRGAVVHGDMRCHEWVPAEGWVLPPPPCCFLGPLATRERAAGLSFFFRGSRVTLE